MRLPKKKAKAQSKGQIICAVNATARCEIAAVTPDKAALVRLGWKRSSPEDGKHDTWACPHCSKIVEVLGR